MIDYLKTDEGKIKVLNYISILKIICVISISITQKYFIFYIIFLLLVFEVIVFIKEIIYMQFIRPKITKKVLIIMFFVSIGLLSFIYKSFISPKDILYLVVADIVFPLIVSFVVLFFWPITVLIKKYYVYKAKLYLSQFENLKVIGVTGSYGKSTTKEFLFTVLKESFKVIKTKGNTNTEIGVARQILSTDFSNYDVFIVEMGAYKKGEIRLIGNMVRPDIGIITSVNEQHLSLFGSIEKTMAAKYELIESVKRDGVSVFNYDNERTRALGNKTKDKKVIFYSKNNNNVDCYATNIQVHEDCLEFNINKRDSVKVNIIGEYNITNIMGVYAIAKALGMDELKIKEGIKKIRNINKTMCLTEWDTNYLIDDTYNANPDGVIAAINHLQTFKKRKKIIVFSHMIELGKEVEHLHEKIGEVIDKVCDEVYFMDIEHAEYMLRGFINKSKVIIEKDPKTIFRYLQKTSNAVILFEGRDSQNILNKIDVS